MEKEVERRMNGPLSFKGMMAVLVVSQEKHLKRTKRVQIGKRGGEDILSAPWIDKKGLMLIRLRKIKSRACTIVNSCDCYLFLFSYKLYNIWYTGFREYPTVHLLNVCVYVLVWAFSTNLYFDSKKVKKYHFITKKSWTWAQVNFFWYWRPCKTHCRRQIFVIFSFKDFKKHPLVESRCVQVNEADITSCQRMLTMWIVITCDAPG